MFKSTEAIVTNNFTNALLAFNQGRADALMWDDSVLIGVATTDTTAKLTTDTFLPLPYGIGIKQGNVALEALGRLAAEPDEAEGHLPVHPQEQRAVQVRRRLLEEHPAPNNTFGYAPAGPSRKPRAASRHPTDHDREERRDHAAAPLSCR